MRGIRLQLCPGSLTIWANIFCEGLNQPSKILIYRGSILVHVFCAGGTNGVWTFRAVQAELIVAIIRLKRVVRTVSSICALLQFLMVSEFRGSS